MEFLLTIVDIEQHVSSYSRVWSAKSSLEPFQLASLPAIVSQKNPQGT
jgi:hypothetical protein